MLLTRLPVWRFGMAPAAAAASIWGYPLVGAAVGACGAAVFALARLGLAPVLAAVLAHAAMVLVTGGLHEDGLADTADGFGGGQTATRKLEIMRDSRIGTYGALALMLCMALRVGTLAGLAHPTLGLIGAGALARGAMLVVLWRLPPARASGLAAPLRATGRKRLLASLGVTALFAVPTPLAGLAVALTAFGAAALAGRQLGGYTGDVLGATEQAAECAALLAMEAV